MGKNRNFYNNEEANKTEETIVEEVPAVEEVVAEAPVETISESVVEVAPAPVVKEEPKKVEVAKPAPAPVPTKKGANEIKVRGTATL